MQWIHGKRGAVARTPGFMGILTALAVGIGSMVWPVQAGAWPKEVGPFAYVANSGSGTVSVIDTARNTVVETIQVGVNPQWAAVSPDGKLAYVANSGSGTVSVIDTSKNRVVATIAVQDPRQIVFAPDGKQAYVASFDGVGVIDTAKNILTATIPPLASGGDFIGLAIAPDGKQVYSLSRGPLGVHKNVSYIDTASNMVVARTLITSFFKSPAGIAVTPDGKRLYIVEGLGLVYVIDTGSRQVVAMPSVDVLTDGGVAIAPDGKHAYFAVQDHFHQGSVAVMDTATNSVKAIVPLGPGFPSKIALTPDGKFAYVTTNVISNEVAVVDLGNNMVVAAIGLGVPPNLTVTRGIGIVPAPPGLPFHDFKIAKLDIDSGGARSWGAVSLGAFDFLSYFTLSSALSNGIHPDTEAVTLEIGGFKAEIPAGSFKKHGDGSFSFQGNLQGVSLKARIKPVGASRYAFRAQAEGANLSGTQNPVQVILIVGDDSGLASVKADFITTDMAKAGFD